METLGTIDYFGESVAAIGIVLVGALAHLLHRRRRFGVRVDDRDPRCAAPARRAVPRAAGVERARPHRGARDLGIGRRLEPVLDQRLVDRGELAARATRAGVSAAVAMGLFDGRARAAGGLVGAGRAGLAMSGGSSAANVRRAGGRARPRDRRLHRGAVRGAAARGSRRRRHQDRELRRRARARVGTVRQRRELAVLALESTQAFRRARSEVGRGQSKRSCASPRRRTSSSRICVPARCARSACPTTTSAP